MNSRFLVKMKLSEANIIGPLRDQHILTFDLFFVCAKNQCNGLSLLFVCLENNSYMFQIYI